MKKILFSIALLAGCADDWGRTDLTVKGDDRFQSTVTKAVDEWNRALYDRCGVVFRIVEEGGRLVEGIGPQEWLDREYPNNTVGLYDKRDSIVIADWLKEGLMNITLHELGHALGLGHESWHDDPTSVMIFVVIAPHDKPSAGDAERAADALGCL